MGKWYTYIIHSIIWCHIRYRYYYMGDIPTSEFVANSGISGKSRILWKSGKHPKFTRFRVFWGYLGITLFYPIFLDRRYLAYQIPLFACQKQVKYPDITPSQVGTHGMPKPLILTNFGKFRKSENEIFEKPDFWNSPKIAKNH